MKRKVIVELEYPDDVDHCWNDDNSGMQTFHDVVKSMAMFGITKMMSLAITKCKEKGLVNTDEIESDRYFKHIQTQADIINEMQTVGYIDDDGKANYFNRTTYKWEAPTNC